MLEHLTHSQFAEHLQETFEASSPEKCALKLTEVKVLGEAVGSRRVPFSLLFYGPRDYFLSQGTYSVSHPELGAMDLFLVPVGEDERGFIYECIFN